MHTHKQVTHSHPRLLVQYEMPHITYGLPTIITKRLKHTCGCWSLSKACGELRREVGVEALKGPLAVTVVNSCMSQTCWFPPAHKCPNDNESNYEPQEPHTCESYWGGSRSGDRWEFTHWRKPFTKHTPVVYTGLCSNKAQWLAADEPQPGSRLRRQRGSGGEWQQVEVEGSQRSTYSEMTGGGVYLTVHVSDRTGQHTAAHPPIHSCQSATETTACGSANQRMQRRVRVKSGTELRERERSRVWL